MTLLLIVLLVLLLCGGGFGYNRYYGGPLGYSNPLFIVLIVLVLLILFGLAGPYAGWHHWW